MAKKKNNVMMQGGQYNRNAGTIILKSGEVISIKDLIAAKKAGIAPEQLATYLQEQARIGETVEVEIEPKKVKKAETEWNKVEWATISRDEIAAAGLKKEKPVKKSFLQKLFGGNK